MKWSSSAPANLMLMGEHSVVYGYPAIASALSPRITLFWQQRDDRRLSIHSDLGHLEISLTERSQIPKDSPFKWILYPILNLRDELDRGFDIRVQSEFESTLGLGSSAAVLAATLGGIHHYLNKHYHLAETFRQGLKVIHQIQGRGSGTDLAAALAGGIVLFDPKKQSITPLEVELDMTLIYSGYKTPTAEVLEKVYQAWLHEPTILKSLYQLMGQTTNRAFEALKENCHSDFYQLINTYQGLMDALGVNDATLSKIVYGLRDRPEIRASKISGSGLGDCVLGIGKLNSLDLADPLKAFKPQPLKAYRPLEIKTSSMGMIIEDLNE